ncbi:uncharacterized protein LOC126799590 [Argentina anserina]|uniref:uncharacterized protein LOC126799590 n=1 Tax=Argentina anserina TaxID=57926 RepID=UPI00217671C7|nr:uncharacterized protein LOC126799590 [Potentilla anserina]XP_050382785.1 uncharacterized protein LOC126799590 [Potentilla anserina]XP_050382786.1 uncharacterized protein LOC126799590 [Potentilla anserina]
MISQTGGLFVGLEDYETQSQVHSPIQDDEEFISMMEMGSANNTNSGRSRSSPPMHLSEPLCSRTTNPSVDSEVPTKIRKTVTPPREQIRAGMKRKRKTPKAQGKNKTKFRVNGSETLTFNARGQAVAPNNKMAEFGCFIGQLVVECSDFPLNAKNWVEICTKGKADEAWLIVEEVAEVNVTNRQPLKLHQTTGAKTFAQVRYEWVLENPGKVFESVTFFDLVHSSTKKDLSNPYLLDILTS